MKKILLVIADITTFGGVERVFVNLANAFCESYEVTILSLCKKNAEPNFPLDKRVKLLFWEKPSANCIEYYKSKNTFYRFYLRHIHSRILSYQIKKAYSQFDIVINTSLYTPYFKNSYTKYVQFIHGPLKRYSHKNKYFDTLVLLSSKELAKWQEFHSDVKVIPNFCAKIFDENIDYNKKIVLAVGRMSSDNQKGFLRLIDIWNIVAKNQKLHEWKLHLVGEGVLKEQIQEKIKKYNLQSRVMIRPFTKKIEREYLEASIYAMSSHFEGFPMVLLEACSYGLAPIAFDVKTGPSDIISNGKSGYLISDGELEEFANKLQEMMQNKSLREQFGKLSKEIIKDNYLKESVIKKWREIIE
ncbi:hypothetical protein B6S12_01830 [Helicobacter valdiviensis]|uniref:Glycosyl transferase family 1 domain-containing protein n=1 Tax=Helicobacter valdiviensis TaxID=1458358 RepID=A0A2W6PQ15_9HELI|nr:glycosyltransferase family 4 protein [Helicobacter valdiviensis]PZT48813.1 hypothetical protein B6S12_01830 [Helicobacter valdiviensis]